MISIFKIEIINNILKAGYLIHIRSDYEIREITTLFVRLFPVNTYFPLTGVPVPIATAGYFSGTRCKNRGRHFDRKRRS